MTNHQKKTTTYKLRRIRDEFLPGGGYVRKMRAGEGKLLPFTPRLDTFTAYCVFDSRLVNVARVSVVGI